MIDFEAINNLITTVGFPIVCYLMAGWYVKYREDRNDEKFDKLNNQHDEENKRITEALNNNTMALQKLADKLGG